MKKYLGSNIKKIRKRWKMKQILFGEYFDLNRGVITAYENNVNEPRITFLLQLEAMTHIPAYDIYYRNLSPAEIPQEPFLNFNMYSPWEQEGRVIRDDYDYSDYLNLNKLVQKVRDHDQMIKRLLGKDAGRSEEE